MTMRKIKSPFWANVKKTKIGTEVSHDTRDSDTTFKVKRLKVNLQSVQMQNNKNTSEYS